MANVVKCDECKRDMRETEDVADRGYTDLARDARLIAAAPVLYNALLGLLAIGALDEHSGSEEVIAARAALRYANGGDNREPAPWPMHTGELIEFIGVPR